MDETCCHAYTTGEVNYAPSMEDVLFDPEYAMYTGDIQLDSYVYCVALHCNPPYCAGLGL